MTVECLEGGLLYDIPLPIFQTKEGWVCVLEDKQHKTHIVKKSRPRFAELSSLEIIRPI